MTGGRLPKLLNAFAQGEWATRDRLVSYALILVAAYIVAGAALVLTGHGDLDWTGRPIGADFAMMWTAGRTALAGEPEAIYALEAQSRLQAEYFGAAAGFTPWHYSPPYLLIATPLAALPYLGALALWQGATIAACLASLRACVARHRKFAGAALLLGAAFPAGFVNIGHGQNGFLTASLLAFGMLALPTRPILAGVLFSCLIYKPQFLTLVPVVLIAGGHWRAMAAGLTSGVAICAATLAIFGTNVWTAFLASLPQTKQLTLELGATGWEKIQSVFAAMRLLGGPYEVAAAAQAMVAVAVIAAIAVIWRSSADARLKHACFFSGVLLTTPYCIDYDMVVLAPAIASLALFGAERGFARHEINLLALAFATPLISRGVASAAHVPLGACVLLILFIWCARRATEDARMKILRAS